MSIKVIVVDDEVSCRESLKSFLKSYCPEVDVIGEADSAKTGKAIIAALQPDLVFLDIEMPFGNAFDLLEQLSDMKFQVVFVTAFSHYAIQALNCSAAYYILKPIDIDELVKAVEKVKENLEQKQDNQLFTKVLLENIQLSNKQHYKLALPVMEGFEVVEVKDIIRCEANDNFTIFYFIDGKRALICRTLKHYEAILTDFGFMRVHKSHLVNLHYVKKYKKANGGQIVMSDDAEIEVSPGKKESFLDRFK